MNNCDTQQSNEIEFLNLKLIRKPVETW